jgi:hypothetical protein
VWRSRTPDGVRCAHFPSVITTIMDYKVQLINPLNLGELLYGSVHSVIRYKWVFLYAALSFVIRQLLT